MPEQQLHRAQIRAMVQQMRRKRMAQGVWRQRASDVRCERMLSNGVPKHHPCHACAMVCDEQVLRLLLA